MKITISEARAAIRSLLDETVVPGKVELPGRDLTGRGKKKKTAIMVQRARGDKPGSPEAHKLKRGVRHTTEVPSGKEPNPERQKRLKAGLKRKDKLRKQMSTGRIPSRVVGGHKADALKEAFASVLEARVIPRKLKSGEPSNGGDSALERVSGKTGHSKPDHAEVKPHVTKASYKKRQRSSAEVSVRQQGGRATWHVGADPKKQIATDARQKPNRHQRKRMMKEAFSILERDGLEISGKVHTNDHGVFKGQGQTRGRKRKVVRSRRDADPEVVKGRAFNTKIRIAADQPAKNRAKKENRDTPRRKLP